MKRKRSYEPTSQIPLGAQTVGFRNTLQWNYNETTLNELYQEFSMIDTTQIINEPDTNEALIKLDKKKSGVLW